MLDFAIQKMYNAIAKVELERAMEKSYEEEKVRGKKSDKMKRSIRNIKDYHYFAPLPFKTAGMTLKIKEISNQKPLSLK